jgi:REP element-mobilizing transposase RayT
MCPTTSPQRGNARQYILNRDEDRAVYLRLLRENIEAYNVTLLGYCLMSSHVHLNQQAAQTDPLMTALSLSAYRVMSVVSPLVVD